MADKMLIDASHPEETRVVVLRNNRVEELDFETEHKKQIKGNIYLAKVMRVEPSLQAAFVDYGGNRHGFLAFSEIHPDYYQIPLADRQALLKADAEERESIESELEGAKSEEISGLEGNDTESEAVERSTEELCVEAQDPWNQVEKDNQVIFPVESSQLIEVSQENCDEIRVDSFKNEDVMEEVTENIIKKSRKQYRIQEVIKNRQILLVQIFKEERGNKGAAVTTYLSLAGRYSVLMPNTERGEGISRKITNPNDRRHLKEIARGLEIPQGMGIILRTAGASRTKVEIKRDFEYLMRLWEKVRTLTLNSTAPYLVYEEGNLIRRSIRDLYNKDISEIIVAGQRGYREAKDFMKVLMPSHAKVVKLYNDVSPIFARSGIEAQLDQLLQAQVILLSGGYIIINQTEALVAIDVNSGRSTKEHSIENTALQTNLEAAEEIARQLRLRDLAGLIVIDFIDMEEKRNNRNVEKRLKESLKHDRARIQIGCISHFGLLEMSRQRIRSSVIESAMQVCDHCAGTGYVRSQSSVALSVLRSIEEYLLQNTTHDITVHTKSEVVLYLLNHKRSVIIDYEKRFGVSITIIVGSQLGNQFFLIEKGAAVQNPVKIEPLVNFENFEDNEDINPDLDEVGENLSDDVHVDNDNVKVLHQRNSSESFSQNGKPSLEIDGLNAEERKNEEVSDIAVSTPLRRGRRRRSRNGRRRSGQEEKIKVDCDNNNLKINKSNDINNNVIVRDVFSKSEKNGLISEVVHDDGAELSKGSSQDMFVNESNEKINEIPILYKQDNSFKIQQESHLKEEKNILRVSEIQKEDVFSEKHSLFEKAIQPIISETSSSIENEKNEEIQPKKQSWWKRR